MDGKIALERLKDGNKRFVNGNTEKPNQTLERLKEVSSYQNPFATIIGCSDSRVPSEIIFDQGLGDLFIVRTAGQVSSHASWGSIEFAYASLNTKLIVVLGHTNCGAVSAACNSIDVPGHIITLINEIKPAAKLAKDNLGDKDFINLAVEYNVSMQVEKLKHLEPILSKAVESGDLLIVGAVYNLETGEVNFLN
jgi:carbonic anhydrase